MSQTLPNVGYFNMHLVKITNHLNNLNKSLHIVCFVLRWYAIMTYSAVLSNNEEDHIHVLEIDMKEKMR